MQEIVFHDVGFDINGQSLLSHFNAEIYEGSFTVFEGESGSGKTTILELCACKRVPTDGVLRFKKENPRIAYMRQSGDVPSKINAFSYVASGLLQWSNWLRRLFNKPSFSDYIRVMDYLEKVRLSHVKNQSLEKLSGGERRRIEIARVLVQDCDIYILDEPIAGLDPQTADMIMQELFEVQHNRGKTVICSMSQNTMVSRYATQRYVHQDGKWQAAHFPG